MRTGADQNETHPTTFILGPTVQNFVEVRRIASDIKYANEQKGQTSPQYYILI
jgi:hypothetical protein